MKKKLERKPRGSEGRVSSNQMNGFFEETVFFRLEVRNVNLEILSKDYWTLEAAKRNAHRRIWRSVGSWSRTVVVALQSVGKHKEKVKKRQNVWQADFGSHINAHGSVKDLKRGER